MDSTNSNQNQPNEGSSPVNPSNQTNIFPEQPSTPQPANPANSPIFAANQPAQPFPEAPAPTEPTLGQTTASMPSQPTTPPSSVPLTTTPTPFNPFVASNSSPATSEPTASEPVPTDLSNLVNTSSEAGAGSTIQPESLVVPPAQPNGNEVNQVAPSSGGGFPKIILFILGGIILLAVSGASAYFILGIGKPTETLPVSAPIEQQPAVLPTSKPSPTPTVSTQSAGLSSLPGSTTTGSGSTGGAGSAYDLLKKRTSTNSANP